MRTFYYNVNFSCNSACIFCAADLRTTHKKSMAFKDILKSFDFYNVGCGDKVIINGGEPTLYPHLLDILRTADSRGAEVILFTNGRLLSRVEVSENFLQYVSRVTIPLYSTTPHLHNLLTGTACGFEQTIDGIHNLLQLRKSKNWNLDLELKCLSIRPCLEENPKIVEFVTDLFGAPDHFVIAGVIISECVSNQFNELVPTWDELQLSISRTLAEAEKHHFHNISLPDIPLCLLDKQSLGLYLHQLYSPAHNNGTRQSEEKNFPRYIYFDSVVPDGLIPEGVDKRFSACKGCLCNRLCDIDHLPANRLGDISQRLASLGIEHLQDALRCVGI